MGLRACGQVRPVGLARDTQEAHLTLQMPHGQHPLLIATGEAIPLRGLEGVPGLPGAPQDEAGLMGKFDI